MPLLSRMLATPLDIDIRPGAVAGLCELLADRRISAHGHIAVAVGPGQGEEIAAVLAPSLSNGKLHLVEGGSLEAAHALMAELRSGSFDAVVGIGGGRTIDVAKYAATMTALPMVAVATSLANDGLASPVASLTDPDGRKGSFGVHIPIAVFVDLDYVRRSPPRQRSGGIGDVLSNLSALADWELARVEQNEPVDGLAMMLARTAAESIIGRTDGIDSTPFLTTLADALVLSGLAMSVAGNSRPCSGGCHEISHALDTLYPGTASHGAQVGVGALFAFFLREDEPEMTRIASCLRRHGLPLSPADLGITEEQFTAAVVAGPATRPDRYTILEHLDLDLDSTRKRVHAFADAFRS
ncbi:MAG TPA: iron-containing alcohol dehydrogenase family protein [Mycobacteriales bacterium]|jgi:glycerol-1-phosphate dehydrogenase [NAD(P)+]|nr:iron-containing alcohol dehydrogenase family protein [Mycobacteriales bacterium]